MAMIKFFLIIQLVISISSADEIIQKAVFDCSSGKMDIVNSQLWLIEETAKQFQSSKTPYEFILTIHSGCTQIVDVKNKESLMDKIQERLDQLRNLYGVKMKVCAIALDRWGYDSADIFPWIEIVPNSINEVIRLQNQGYAYILYN